MLVLTLHVPEFAVGEKVHVRDEMRTVLSIQCAVAVRMGPQANAVTGTTAGMWYYFVAEAAPFPEEVFNEDDLHAYRDAAT